MSITRDRMPWLIDVNVFMTPISHTNFNTNTATDINAIRNGYRSSSGAQNDSISFDVILAAGTWDIELLHLKSTNHGIFSVQLDDVAQGTIDAYNASGTYNNHSSVTGINISTSGKKRLTLKMAMKNASSSSYYGRIQHIQLRRTA